MKVKIQDLDKPNLNKRIYPKEMMEKAIIEYKKEYIDKNRAFILSNIPNDIDNYDIRRIIGKVNSMEIENSSVGVEIDKLNINNSDGWFTAIAEGKLYVRLSGTGNLEKQEDGNFILVGAKTHLL